MAIDNKLDSIPKKEAYKEFSISVREVEPSMMKNLYYAYFGKYEQIGMFDFIETDENQPIMNQGADPCLIIYAKCRENGKLISGHFLDNFGNDQDDFLKETQMEAEELKKKGLSKFIKRKTKSGLALPNKNGEREFAGYFSQEKYKYIERYNMMLKKIKEWITKFGGDSVEIYLFGQHFYADADNPDEIQYSLMARLNIITDLNRIGVSLANVCDNRSLEENTHEVCDDTFYSPETKTIFFQRKE